MLKSTASWLHQLTRSSCLELSQVGDKPILTFRTILRHSGQICWTQKNLNHYQLKSPTPHPHHHTQCFATEIALTRQAITPQRNPHQCSRQRRGERSQQRRKRENQQRRKNKKKLTKESTNTVKHLCKVGRE